MGIKYCNKCDNECLEEYYIYNDGIYCPDCLLESLEDYGEIKTYYTKTYYSDDGCEYYGNSDDYEEVIENICEDLDIEMVNI